MVDQTEKLIALMPNPSEGESPFQWKHIKNLYLKPEVFFSSKLALGGGTRFFLIMWLMGVSILTSPPDRSHPGMIFSALFQAFPPEQHQWADLLNNPLLTYWLPALVIGLIVGFFLTFMGAMLFDIFLSIAGARFIDDERVRLIYIYGFLAFVAPWFILNFIDYLLFFGTREWESIFRYLFFEFVTIVFYVWLTYIFYRTIYLLFETRKFWFNLIFLFFPAWGFLASLYEFIVTIAENI